LDALRGEIDALSARRKAVADESQYTDLPPRLRASELAKIDGFISTFSGLLNDAAMDAVKNNPGESEDALKARMGAERDGDAPIPEDPGQRQLHELRDRITLAQQDVADSEWEATEAIRAYQDAFAHGVPDGVAAVSRAAKLRDQANAIHAQREKGRSVI